MRWFFRISGTIFLIVFACLGVQNKALAQSPNDACSVFSDIQTESDTSFSCEEGVLIEIEQDNSVLYGSKRISSYEVNEVPFGVAHVLTKPESFFGATNTIALYKKSEPENFLFVETIFDGNTYEPVVFESAGDYRLAVLASGTVHVFDFSVAEKAVGDFVYQEMFNEDPQWDTDLPEGVFWDEDDKLMRVHFDNQERDYHPNKYLVHKIPLNPNQSFFVSGDMRIDAIDRDGMAVFGVYSDDLIHSKTRFIRPGSTVNAQLTSFVNRNNAFDFNIYTEDGSNLGSGGSGGNKFQREIWYTFYISFDAEVEVVRMAFVNRETGEVYRSTQREVEEQFAGDMQYVGISYYPEGEPGSILSQGPRIDGSSDLSLDNVEVLGLRAQSNVLFLPGVQGSRLYTDSLGFENKLWVSKGDSDARFLEMNTEGDSVNDIYTKDIIDRPLEFANSIYGNFTERMNNSVADGDIREWQPFPYDWRHDVFEIVEEGTALSDGARAYPTTTVANLAGTSDTGKVTIVAHSNGGLLAKALMLQLAEEGLSDLVDTIVFVGVPQAGTPKAIGTILHGQDMEKARGFVMNDDTARDVIRNMPGAYGLLPSNSYFESIDNEFIDFRNFDTTQAFREAYGESIDSSEEFNDFLTGAGDGRSEPTFSAVHEPLRANNFLLEEATTQHALLDAWQPPEGVAVHEIIGWGIPTPSGYEYREVTELDCVLGIFSCEEKQLLKPFMQLSSAGDRTVMASSAGAGGFTQWYVDLIGLNNVSERKIAHADFMESPVIQEMVSNILAGEAVPSSFISPTPPEEEREYDILSVHSPVTISVVDEDGNTTGVVDGDISEGITESFYFEVGDSKYVVVPSDTEYSVEITGEETGSYTLTIDQLSGETTENLKEVSKVEVVEDSVSTFEKTEEGFSELSADTDGDGETDETFLLSDEVSPEEEVDSGGSVARTSGNGGGVSISLSEEESDIKVLGARSVDPNISADTPLDNLSVAMTLAQNPNLTNAQREIIIIYLKIVVSLLRQQV